MTTIEALRAPGANPAPHPRRLALLLTNLNGGGAERVVLSLASGFVERGYTVDLLVCELRGELLDELPIGVNVVELSPVSRLQGLYDAFKCGGWTTMNGIFYWLSSARKIPRSFRYIRAIIKYLEDSHPTALLSALNKTNVSAMLAAAGARVDTRVYVGVHNTLSTSSRRCRESGRGQTHSMIPLLKACYPRADGVIAVSKGVAEDAIALLRLPEERVHVIYNPVFDPAPGKTRNSPPVHPWFRADEPPVILGMGRMADQKNFPLLITAFAEVRRQRPVRLVILGGDASSAAEMAHRAELERLAAQLGVADDVELPGFQHNPFRYLEAASLFVLSSDYEGFGNVLVEALIAGCPVVSTDCPSGPAEILKGGKYGTLVPVNDAGHLARAMLDNLDASVDPVLLRKRGAEFSLDNAISNYQAVLFSSGARVAAPEPDLSVAASTSAAIR